MRLDDPDFLGWLSKREMAALYTISAVIFSLEAAAVYFMILKFG